MSDKQQQAPERVWILGDPRTEDDTVVLTEGPQSTSVEYVRADLLQRVPDEKRLAELLKVAQTAQAKAPGPWGRTEANFITHKFLNDDSESGIPVAEVDCYGGYADEIAPYIAALDPSTAIDLILRAGSASGAAAVGAGLSSRCEVGSIPAPALLQQPPAASERCGECGHSEPLLRGYCQHKTYVQMFGGAENEIICGCKCVFPATGAPEGGQRNIWATLHQRRAELVSITQTRLLTGEETADLIALQRVGRILSDTTEQNSVLSHGSNSNHESERKYPLK